MFTPPSLLPRIFEFKELLCVFLRWLIFSLVNQLGSISFGSNEVIVLLIWTTVSKRCSTAFLPIWVGLFPVIYCCLYQFSKDSKSLGISAFNKLFNSQSQVLRVESLTLKGQSLLQRIIISSHVGTDDLVTCSDSSFIPFHSLSQVSIIALMTCSISELTLFKSGLQVIFLPVSLSLTKIKGVLDGLHIVQRYPPCFRSET